jgi:hypothetical protein
MVAWNKYKEQLMLVEFSTFEKTHPTNYGGGSLIREELCGRVELKPQEAAPSSTLGFAISFIC